MDEAEFKRLLQLFPVVRSRDYCAEPSSSRASKQLASGSAQDELKDWQDAWDERDANFENKGTNQHDSDWQDAWDERDANFENKGTNQHDSFWGKLKSEAAKKVGPEEAERFCKAFQQIHKKLVHEELNLDAARSFINSS